ncbi:MAG: hypothetical protein AMXMBFR7_19940 [Planctomycetota bacterium]
MSVAAFIHLIGSMGVFPSRAFIPAWVTAMLLRFGHEIPAIKNSGLLDLCTQSPTWFTHDATLVVLGILALLELISTKNAEVRAFMNDLDQFIKPAMATVTALGVLSSTDAAIAHEITQQGFGDLPLALMVGAGVWFLTTIRGAIVSVLLDADETDELGLQKVIAWLEDLWSAFGILLLVIYPLVMLGIAALIAGGFWAMRAYLAHREEQSKKPCASCGTPMYLSALACPKCAAKPERTHAVGFFGSTLNYQAKDLAAHPYELAEKKRCPNCATHLEERDPTQSCHACGKRILSDPSFAQEYQRRVGERLPTVLGISFALSLVPIVGLIPGLIYYRIKLVAPYRRYVSRSMGCLLRVAVRILILALIVLQIVPVLGALMLPLMAMLEYSLYKSVFESALKQPPAEPVKAA